MSSVPKHLYTSPLDEARLRENVLLGMENPLLDISVELNDHHAQDILGRYGLEANSAILAEEKHKPLYEEIVNAPHEPFYVAGGATQNTIRGAQWLLPSKSTVYIGCVGKDKYAEKLKKAAEADGVRVEYLEDAKGTPTGTCAVLVSNKGRARSLVANLAAANEYDPSLHLYTPSIWPLVESAHYYYIGGFFFTVSPEAIQKVAQHAAENNKWFIQNLSAPFISQFFTKPLDEASPYWDVLIGNEAESDAYAESHGLAQHKGDLHAVARHIQQLPKANTKRERVVVLTHGHKPTVVAVKGHSYEFPVEPIVKDDIVDTNGAGDAFAGGFVAELIKGGSLEQCVKAGQYVAAQVIKVSGAVYPKHEPQFVFKSHFE